MIEEKNQTEEVREDVPTVEDRGREQEERQRDETVSSPEGQEAGSEVNK